jgi:hypothetical protein
MNVIVPPTMAGTALGEVLAAWPVAPGALLLLGWHRGAMPPDGVMQLERRRADRGPFRCLSWRLDEDDGPSGFLAAVRLPPATTAAPGQQMTLIEGDRPGMVARLPDRFIGPDAFANAAADQGGRHGAALVRFLLQAFQPAAMQRLPDVAAMLARLLARVATADGCVEIMGAVPDACAFLQGWGRKLADSAELVLVGAQLTRCEAQIATFERPDIMAPATGVVLVLPADAQAALQALETAYLVTPKTILRRDVVERRLLSPSDSLGHVRDIVASLTCAPATADCLRRALRPPYEGRATLEEQPHPVRAAIDLAMVVPGAGAFVSGWLFDPLGVVDAVHLRGGGGALRLDEGWTRVQRPDVSEAMRGALPPSVSDTHGFAIFAPARMGDGAFYLDIGFHDGTCGFLPVPAQPCDDEAAQQRALEITDLHKPSGIEIVERHLGPLFLQLRRRPRAPLPAAPRPDTRPHAIVVALDAQCVLPRAFLSQFLHDPLDAAERLVLVCDAAWAGAALDALRRLLAFADIDALVLRVPADLTATGALDLAMAATQAADFLLLSPDAVHGEPGWRAALRVAASRGAKPAVACPTLLYEDRSYRFAGNNSVHKLPSAPYLLVEHHLAGLPAASSANMTAPNTSWDAQPTTIGSLACCLVPAQVLTALGGAQQGMSTPQTEERAFFLRLRRAGIACLWVPQARLHAPDSATPAPAHAAVGTLVDNWGMRALLASEA